MKYNVTVTGLGPMALEFLSPAMEMQFVILFNEDAPAEEISEHVISTSEKMEIVVEFIKTRLDAIKGGQVACGTLSVIEALKGFNDLLKQGIITQEEFDAKKKQILGL